MAETPRNESVLFTLSMPAEIMFCNLFEKRAITINGKKTDREQWDMTVLLPADGEITEIKKLCAAMFKQRFPAIDLKNPRNWMRPWESGEDYIARQRADKGDKAYDNEFVLGKVLLKSHSVLYAPNLSVNMPGRGVVDFRDDARMTIKDKFYPGCQVLAEYNFQVHKVGTNTPGVTAYLNKVCSLNKGERRGGGKSGSETFGAYIGKISAIDPTDIAY